MSSIVMNRMITEENGSTKDGTLLDRIGKYITETAETMAAGVFAMNNTYYRPVK